MSQAGSFETGAIFDVETLTGNAGGAVGPTLGNIDLLGGNNITATGVPATSTITFDLTGTTNHAVQVGNATGSLTSLAAATDGQLVIGSTGVDPVVAALTPGTGIDVTNGAGSITVSTVADGFETVTVQTVGAVTGDLFTFTVGEAEAITINATVTGAASGYSASLVGTVSGGARRVAAGATTLVGSPIANFNEDSGGAPIIDIVVSGNDVIVRVTGVAAETWNWRGLIQYVHQTA